MVSGLTVLSESKFRLTRDLPGSDELPFLIRDTARGGTTMRMCRYWRSMPRLARSLLTLAIFISVIWIGSVLTFSVPSIPGPGLEKVKKHQPQLQRDLDNQESDNNNLAPTPPASDQERKDKEENERRNVPAPRAQPLFKGPTNERQAAIVAAFQHAWKGYKHFAWGHDQLKPVSKGFSDWFDTGLTIVDGIDTAIIMGLEQEVAEATAWIRDNLNFNKDRYVNVFEATIRVLGGLLSAFHLTTDQMFLDRALDVGTRLTGAWKHSKTAIPLSDVNLKTREAKGPTWSADSSLSEVTTVQLEFRELSRLTKNSSFEEMAFQTSLLVHEEGCAKHEGLCEMFLNANTGKFKDGTTISLGARADSYYEYLLKQWLQTGQKIHWLVNDYKTAMDSMIRLLLKESEPNKLRFVGELLAGSSFSPKMDHLVCFIGGTLALGTLHGLSTEHLEVAKEVGATCHKMYETATGLAPEIAHFNMDVNKNDDVIIKEWGWQAFQAIEKYARIPTGGYSSVNNVKTTNVNFRDLMESFFLAETLKYLYLLLSDDQTILPLDKWVFNTEGHPLPIRDN